MFLMWTVVLEYFQRVGLLLMFGGPKTVISKFLGPTVIFTGELLAAITG